MIKRIVKMNFKAEHISDFKTVFDASKHLIRAFEGCTHLELWQDAGDPQTFFTYSFWNAEGDLENYRHSELFKSVWSKTKVLFNDKPQAWTVKGLHSL
jgi:heme-degrading monooxygenase HmoA